MHYSYEDYIALESLHSVKHEFCGGEIYAMGGGTPAHGALAMAIARQLGNQLAGRCTVLSSDVRVRIAATDLTTYPDVSVVCGKVELDGKDAHAIINPTLVIEVTSPSSVDYDRGEKLRNYQQLDSVRAVIIVAHDTPRVTLVVRRGAGEWATSEHISGIARLADPAVELDIDHLYAAIAQL
jgi:Uma2 family endonuclease